MNWQQMDLEAMQRKIEQIETLVLELKDAGAGIPVIEKNARAILSFTNILKGGICDPAELTDS